MLSLATLLVAALLCPQVTVIYDDAGMPYELAEPPQRIISLAPNITEILFALGLGDRIVGVTRYCDYPELALRKEKIGGMVDPNLERIQALRPDLIIGFPSASSINSGRFISPCLCSISGQRSTDSSKRLRRSAA